MTVQPSSLLLSRVDGESCSLHKRSNVLLHGISCQGASIWSIEGREARTQSDGFKLLRGYVASMSQLQIVLQAIDISSTMAKNIVVNVRCCSFAQCGK